MKRLYVVLTLLLCLMNPGFPLAQSEQRSGDDRAPKETAAEKGAVQAGRSPDRSKKPAKSFKPSERIRADSAVSFPVDI